MAFLLEMGLSESYDLALQLNFDVIGRSLSSDALSRPSGATVYLKKNWLAGDNNIKTKKIHRNVQTFLQLFCYYLYLAGCRKNSNRCWYISMLTATACSPGTIPVAKNRYHASLHEGNNQGRGSMTGESPMTCSTLAHRTVLGPWAVRLHQCSPGAGLAFTRDWSSNQVLLEFVEETKRKPHFPKMYLICVCYRTGCSLPSPVLRNSTVAVIVELEWWNPYEE